MTVCAFERRGGVHLSRMLGNSDSFRLKLQQLQWTGFTGRVTWHHKTRRHPPHLTTLCSMFTSGNLCL